MTRKNQPEKPLPGPFSLTGLTETQLRLIADALEFHSRFLMGQVTAVPPVLFWHERMRDPEVSQKVEALLYQVKALIWPDWAPNQWGGVGWSADRLQQDAQRGYELYKMILYHFNRDAGVMNVHSSPPLHYSDQPLAQVITQKSKEEK